jgi:hypothetical protein
MQYSAVSSGIDLADEVAFDTGRVFVVDFAVVQ